MSQKKILIADDSQNIQKVINLVLSQKDYIVENCENSENLLSIVAQKATDLVLLDFTLSEKIDGYELVGKIKETYDDVKVIVMFGTFDSVEDEKLKSYRIDSYIYKPFDGDKLISLIEEQLAVVGVEANQSDKADDEPELPPSEIDGSAPEVESVPEAPPEIPTESESEFDQWGVNVPEIIDEEEQSASRGAPSLEISTKEDPAIPEVDEALALDNDENQLPSDDDLEYPDLTPQEQEVVDPPTIKLSLNDHEAPEDVPVLEDTQEAVEDIPEDGIELSSGKKLNFLSAEDLAPDERSEIDIQREEKTDVFDIPSLDRERESEINKIREEIQEELEEDSWEAESVNEKKDQFITSLSQLGSGQSIDEEALKEKIKSELIDDLKTTLVATLSEDIKEQVLGQLRLEVQNLGSNLKESLVKSLESELKTELKPVLEDKISQYCREAVEKDIWEILPDLADKVIKSELKLIRESIN
jgi:DNA-binding response OmpR family regulator